MDISQWQCKITILHEYGHALMVLHNAKEEFGPDTKNPNLDTDTMVFLAQGDREWRQVIKENIRFCPSYYARSNSAEMFAEWYASYKIGETVPDGVKSYIDKVEGSVNVTF